MRYLTPLKKSMWLRYLMNNKILEEGWMKKNFVSIFMNSVTIIIMIVTIAVFITRTDAKASANEEDIRLMKVVDIELDRRIDAEELFRVEAMTRLEYISIQIDVLREDLKIHEQ